MTRTAVGNRERINFFMDLDLFSGLRTLARLKNTTYSELIRVAVREYVAREARGAMVDKQAMRQLAETKP